MIFVKNLTEFYQISLKHLPDLTDFSPQLMACLTHANIEHSLMQISTGVNMTRANTIALFSVTLTNYWHMDRFYT